MMRALLLVCIVFVLQLFFIAQPKIVHADQFSWSGTANPSVVSSDPSTVQSNDCLFHQNMTVAGELSQKNVCLTDGSPFQFGTYSENGANIPVIRTSYDQNMYKLKGICSLKCIYLPSKDMLVTKRNLINGFVQSLVIYKNFSSRVAKTTNGSNFAVEYTFNSANPDYVFKNADDYAWPIGGITTSDNEDWLVFEARERAVMVLNTDTFAIKIISVQLYHYGVGFDPAMEFAVTDDGQKVAMMGHNTSALVFDVSDNCGDVPSDEQLQDNRPIAQPCPSKDLASFSDSFIERFSEGNSPSFNIDGGELTFYAASYSVPSKLVVLRASGYQPPVQLDYLALGDSISSGEGDTEVNSSGQKHYLAFTDIDGNYENGIPREKCHQSFRAWPFVLAGISGINDNKKETVACSGAKITDIEGGSQKYEGQGRGDKENKPRLQGLSNIISLQTDALGEFTPGRIRQINFIERYTPKVISVTISGNDVGFAKVLDNCIGRVNVGDTCDYADTDQGKAIIGKLITNQYDSLVNLYTRLHKASPQTKIYAFGYPKFISTGNECDINVRLSNNERFMAAKAVEYLNNIIENAAKRSGVEYINIEDSLYGKRLCDTKQPYVTGIAGHAPFTKSEEQESFHPNAKGNEMIANYIKSTFDSLSSTILTHRNCPLPFAFDFCPDPTVNPPDPTYFTDAMNGYNVTVKNEQLTNNIIDKTNPQTIKTEPLSLEPGSNVNIEIHSEPVSLGSYIVNQDGSLLQTITIPSDISSGSHTLHLHGNSYSGEPIDLTQIIEVQGQAGDIDEDGIADNVDPCLYISAAQIDADLDGVDDACDPQINSLPYRVRNGDINKGENANYLYIERNTNASDVTGISGDYDPDNDGWAIVAASNNQGNSGKSANFVIDNTKIPHVSIRTNNNGCVRFTPLSLTKVIAGEQRTLKQEAANTNTCRSEAPEADTDHNNIPDNQQLLYRARNGLVANGENTRNIYLERNRTAAEAQLGISDYLPNNQISLWSTVASGQNLLTQGTYRKLIYTNNKPTILINGLLNLCFALTPENLTVVTQSSSTSRALNLGLVPWGQGCG